MVIMIENNVFSSKQALTDVVIASVIVLVPVIKGITLVSQHVFICIDERWEE